MTPDHDESLGEPVPSALRMWEIHADFALGREGAADGLMAVARSARREGVGRGATIGYLNGSITLFPFLGSRTFDFAREGLEYARMVGIAEVQRLLGIVVGWGLVKVGRWGEAVRAFDDALPSLSGDEYALEFWRAARAEMFAAMGRSKEALELAERAYEQTVLWDIRSMRVEAQAILIPVLSSVGRSEQAMELLGELASAPRRPRLQGDDEFVAELMRCALACQNLALAERLLQGRPPGIPLVDAGLASGSALLAEARGRREAAAAGFADAAARWHEFGVPYEEAQALLGEGRCLVALGRVPQEAPVLGAAREIFVRLGARPALAETEALLRAS